MGNHYHLLVETPEGNLSAGMRQLNGVYTQHVNRRHCRVGHVFQGRFKAVVVERESHLLELARYIVLNPVRAGMVADAVGWRWSSHAEMLGLRSSPRWLCTDALLQMFGTNRSAAVAAYVDFVRAGVGLPPVWEGLRGQIYLGSDKFVDSMLVLASLTDATDLEIPRSQRRPAGKGLPEYAAHHSRDEAMALAYESGNHTMREIATHFGVHYATVSRAVRNRRRMLDCKT
jgi:hypothetical protein